MITLTKVTHLLAKAKPFSQKNEVTLKGQIQNWTLQDVANKLLSREPKSFITS